MNAVILCCETLATHLRAAQETCRTDYPVVWLDRKLHAEPARMREHILVKISELPQEVDTVLVAMGFCGGSWQDVCCDIEAAKAFSGDAPELLSNALYQDQQIDIH